MVQTSDTKRYRKVLIVGISVILPYLACVTYCYLLDHHRLNISWKDETTNLNFSSKTFYEIVL